MNLIITIIQILLALSLITLVFLQSNGDTDGRGNIMSSINFQKRGWEKVTFYATIIILALFLLISLVQTFI